MNNALGIATGITIIGLAVIILFTTRYADGLEKDIKSLEAQNATIEKRLTQTEDNLKEAYKELDKSQMTASELQSEVDNMIQANLAKDAKIRELEKQVLPPSRLLSRGQQYRQVGKLGDDFEITWYNDYGYTKSGRFVLDGVTVAVDPNIIPLGTWLHIEFPDGREFIRRADDTGGAVKGHIIDIYDNASDGTLINRGRTHGVKVTIIERI